MQGREGQENRALPASQAALPPSGLSQSPLSQAKPAPANAFTPGPWFVDGNHVHQDDEAGGRWLCIAKCDQLIRYAPRTETAEYAQTVANAHLIAAAPELYEALEHILRGTLSLPRFAEDMARAALAKARGQ